MLYTVGSEILFWFGIKLKKGVTIKIFDGFGNFLSILLKFYKNDYFSKYCCVTKGEFYVDSGWQSHPGLKLIFLPVFANNFFRIYTVGYTVESKT